MDTTKPLTRKLTAIFYADVAGYSSLTGADEEGTHRLLSAYLDGLTEAIHAHQGQVLHYAGDAILAEFATVSAALSCAAAIQYDLKARNESLPEARRLQFRIGVNLGEVIADRGEIYGDGVNVAVRLENLAEPGGICVSGTVFDAIGAKLPMDYEFIGEQGVKNIAKPVRAYRVRMKPDAVLPAPTARAPAKPPSIWRLGKRMLAASVVALIVLAGVGGWWWQRPAPPEPAANSTLQSSATDPILALPKGPTIAVLPFNNMSGDPKQEYFADGITEDIITELSRFHGLGVIARNSTFRYKDHAVDVRQVGRELNADYVVEGSIRREAERIRVTVQLLNAADAKHVWAETYDRKLTAGDVFAIQDEITHTVTNTIASEHGILSREIAKVNRSKRTDELSSYDCMLRLHEYDRVNTAETHLAALRCLEHTVQVDPNYADAWAALAEIYADSYALDLNPIENALDKALAAAQRGLALDPTSQQVMFGLTYTHLVRRERDQYLTYAEKLVRLNPDNAFWLGSASYAIAWSGQCERALALFDKAVKFNPYHPGWWHFPFIMSCYYPQGKYDLALAEAQKIDIPDLFWTPLMFAMVYAQMGRTEDAKTAMREALTLNPDIAKRPRFYAEIYISSAEVVDKILDGWLKAGLADAETKSRAN